MAVVKNFISILKEAFTELKKNDPLRLAGATAFFTTFAFPPITIILIQMFGLFYNPDKLDKKFFEQLFEVLGKESGSEIRRTFLGFKALAQNWIITIGGFIFLVFVATTLFKVIKDSINQLWNIKIDYEKKIGLNLQTRLISLVVIIFAGFLFLAGMIAEGYQAVLSNYLFKLFPATSSFLNQVISKLLSVLVVTTWFTILFKFLTDAIPSWRVAISGAFFTGILFTIGKIVILTMLPFKKFNSVFGASTSIVLLLLFLFYSSLIFYYGACFTKAYAKFIKSPILPGAHAFRYELAEIKSDERVNNAEVDRKEEELKEEERMAKVKDFNIPGKP
jgi:membrane protein